MTTVATTILTSNTEQDKESLIEFAEFWKIPYSTKITSQSQDVIFSSGRIDNSRISNHPCIVSPRVTEDFDRIAADHGLGLRKRSALLELPEKANAKVSMQTTTHELTGPKLEPVISLDSQRILSRLEGTKTYFLSIDLVSEYRRTLNEGLDDAPSARFRTLSRLPIPYSLVPSSIRNMSLRRAANRIKEERRAPIDFLRTLFLASLASVSEKPIPRLAFWRNGKLYSMTVTHDVETKLGLEGGAKNLSRIETDMGVRSTWNIPSDRYHLPEASLREIAEQGDIGAHDTRHDGRLVLSSYEEMVRRAQTAKKKLERLTRVKVAGFRAPLLQHSRKLLSAIGAAGYEYDSSVPAWEMISPTSLRPHGIGTSFPLRYDNFVEVPVSLPQDHQLMKIQNLTPELAVKHILDAAAEVRNLGGACVLLVHPDYEYGLPENEREYRTLLTSFQKDPNCDIMTMSEMVDWWTERSKASIDTTKREPRIVQPGLTELQLAHSGLSIEYVLGYGEEGFRVENKV